VAVHALRRALATRPWPGAAGWGTMPMVILLSRLDLAQGVDARRTDQPTSRAGQHHRPRDGRSRERWASRWSAT
jgi:hypothetical protein